MNGFDSLSTVFDETVAKLLGSSLDEYFKNPSAFSLRRTIRKNGHTIVKIVHNTVDDNVTIEGYYLDDKLVEEEDIKWVLKDLNSVEAEKEFEDPVEPFGCSNKLPIDLNQGTKILYTDMLITKSGELVLKFAMPGVAENRIDIYTEDNFLIVKVLEVNPKYAKEPSAIYLQKEIKDCGEFKWKKIFIDPYKFKIDGTTFIYENGLLTITIPKNENPDIRKKYSNSLQLVKLFLSL